MTLPRGTSLLFLLLPVLAAAAPAKEEAAPAWAPTLKPGPGQTLIVGQVLDHEGKPRTGGVVNLLQGPVTRLERAYPGFPESDLEGIVRLEADGHFQLLRELEDGVHLVKALVDEGDNLRVAVGEVVVEDRRAAPITLQLGAPVQLHGVVTDTARKPLAGVPLAIVPVPPPSLGGEAGLRPPSPGTLSHTESGDDGTFVFEPVDPGRYAVYPIGARYDAGGTLIVHAGDKASLFVSLKPVLRAEVVDTEGQPIPLFRARIDDGPPAYFRVGTLQIALGRRHPGPGLVELLAPEHPSFLLPQSIPLGSEDDIDLGKITLPPGREVTLEVRGLVKGPRVSRPGGDHEDAEELEIRAFSGEGSKRVEEPRLKLPEPRKSKGSLVYPLRGLPEGPVLLVLEAPGRTPLFVEVPAKAKRARAMFRRGVTLELRLREESGRPVPGATVHLRQVRENLPFLERGTTDPRGRVRFRGLFGGEATLHLRAPDRETEEKQLELPERGRHQELITLAPPEAAPEASSEAQKAP